MNNETIKHDVQHALERLQGLRDDVRVRVHLASLDLKQAWDALDPQVAEAEKLAKQAGDAARDAARDTINELVQKLTELRNALGDRKLHP